MMLYYCDLTKFNGKIHSINNYMEEPYKGKLSYTQFRMICREIRDKSVRKTLPMSHKVPNGPSCFLISSERSLAVAGSKLSLVRLRYL